MYDVAFVTRSRLRRDILQIVDKPKTVKRMCKELNKYMSVVSRALREMEKKKMLICLNPKDDRNRYYQITKKGKNILKKVKEIEG